MMISRKVISYYITSIYEGIWLKTIGAAIGWLAMFLFGAPTAGLYAFIAICAIDFGLGIAVAIADGTFNWRRFFRGIGKYFTFGLALIVARQIDTVIGDIMDFLSHIDSHMILFQYWMLGILAIHEGLSVLGKLSGMGVPIPNGMVQRLREYQESLESKEPEKV